MNVFFFVIIPVYNAQNYIGNCLESVTTQSYGNLTAIVVDDGSEDRSMSICQEYADRDNRIIILHQKNQGALAAREMALKYIQKSHIENSKDSFVVFLDSDDSLKSYALSEINKVAGDGTYDLIFYGMDRTIKGKFIKHYNKEEKNQIITNKRQLYRLVFNNAEYNPLCRKAIKLSLLDTADYSQYYSVINGEDLLRSLPLYKNCKRVYFLNEYLYNYNINPHSVTENNSLKFFKVDFTVREKVNDFLKRENVFNKKDWEEYRSNCIRLLVNTYILKIATLACAYNYKVELYKTIKRSNYFLKFIKKGRYKITKVGPLVIIYWLFNINCYRLIDLLMTLRLAFRRF